MFVFIVVFRAPELHVHGDDGQQALLLRQGEGVAGLGAVVNAQDGGDVLQVGLGDTGVDLGPAMRQIGTVTEEQRHEQQQVRHAPDATGAGMIMHSPHKLPRPNWPGIFSQTELEPVL